ncbi:MAG: DUF1926 domain-containing protein [Candidatus Eisenbacteria bacterium]|nr:DUF1926 domain-containing protein [Candidatus Eisenbacteria bacterium]
MKKTSFVFCVHNHQPVGNLDFVLEDAFERAYLAFLNVLARHPSIKTAFHVSGALLEWIERHHPQYFDLVRSLVTRGQLEIMTGGFYEPVLPSVPDEDKIGQTRKLTSFVKEKFGFQARGLWLAERVWEPSLASAIGRAGVEYTVVDDSHFKSAGLPENELLGYYLTEDQGTVIKVFSGSKRLRYLIPYADPHETLDYLREKASETEDTLLVFADDGEKFGIWPGTHKLCYEDKWLERFFTALEANKEWVSVVTFSEYISQHKPLGWVFLPAASYAEMMEWSLPVEAQLRYHEFLGKLSASGEFERYESFVKGGFWRNFLSRYPESNWMHKRMLYARRKVLRDVPSELRKASSESRRPLGSAGAREVALNEIWKAQCNCAYWHGVFGGLYLPHLREAIYRHIIRADKLASEVPGNVAPAPTVERVDVDGDGAEEIAISNGKLVCFIAPARGGTVVEIDDVAHEINLVNTLARRREAYHSQIKTGAGDKSGEKVASIHDAVVAKEEKLDEFLFYDRFPRVCLLDHFLSPRTSLSELFESKFEDLGNFAGAPYTEKSPFRDGRVVLSASGMVRSATETARLTIDKTLSVPAGVASLQVSYDLSFGSQRGAELLFVPELNLLIPSGRGAQGKVDTDALGARVVELSSPGEFLGVRGLTLTDERVGLSVTISMGTACKLWQFPVETVSLSEGGLEKIYQGTCVMLAWPLPAGIRQASFDIRMEFKTSDAKHALTSSTRAAGR